MKITGIEECKKNKDRVNIYIDDEFFMAASKYCCVKYNLKPELTVDMSYIKEIISEDNYGKGKDYALRILERGMKSKKELIGKLKLKDFSQEDIEKIISFLEEYNYINDDTYTKYYIQSYKNSKSKLFIKKSLINKGINKDIIDKHLLSMDNSDEKEKVRNLALKKYNSLKGKDKREIRKKIGDMLLRRGYEFDLVKKAVNEILEEDGDYD